MKLCTTKSMYVRVYMRLYMCVCRCMYLLALSFSMSLSFNVSTQSPGQLYPLRPLESDVKKEAGSPETMATTI